MHTSMSCLQMLESMRHSVLAQREPTVCQVEQRTPSPNICLWTQIWKTGDWNHSKHISDMHKDQKGKSVASQQEDANVFVER
jgi:hypothetical protein